MLGIAVLLVCPVTCLVQALPQFRGKLTGGFGAVEGQGQRGDRRAVQAGADDLVGVGGRRVEQGCFAPPWIIDCAGEGCRQAGAGADVPGGQVLLEGQVREGIPAGGGFYQQPVAGDVIQERLPGD